jgi:hypothetical protein
VKQAFDPESVRDILRRGIANGWWTLEDLDTPSPGFISNMDVDRRHFPNGYQGIQHRNLLRDTDQIPNPDAEALSSPYSTPQPPAPVSPTQDPAAWPF